MMHPQQQGNLLPDSRQPTSRFPFLEVAREIVQLYEAAASEPEGYVRSAYDSAAAVLDEGDAGVERMRSAGPTGTAVPWQLLDSNKITGGEQLLRKLAARFVLYLFLEHLQPPQRKQWALRHVDWSGCPHDHQEVVVDHYFDGQGFKNAKRMVMDHVFRTERKRPGKPSSDVCSGQGKRRRVLTPVHSTAPQQHQQWLTYAPAIPRQETSGPPSLQLGPSLAPFLAPEADGPNTFYPASWIGGSTSISNLALFQLAEPAPLPPMEGLYISEPDLLSELLQY